MSSTTTPDQANPPTDAATDPAPAVVCPYCGAVTPRAQTCASCGGLFEPLSIQATQNEMGPWFIRDQSNPFQPGCSLQTLRKLAQRGRITPETVIRGPTTRQFWSVARNVRGVAHLLGECQNCHGPAGADEYMCRSCGSVFEAPTDRQRLGVGVVRLIPGQTPAQGVAQSPGAPSSSTNTSTTKVSLYLNPARRDATPAKASSGASVAAERRFKRRLRQSRRIITMSVALNVVLFATLLIVGMSSRLSVRGVGADESTDAAGREASITDRRSPVDGADALASARWSDRLERARTLASSDRIEDLREAEKLLDEIRAGTPAEELPIEVGELRQRVRDRLDELSLAKFLPDDQR